LTDTFDAASVSELAYNFDKWLDHRPELKRGRQVIPEPSSDAVTEFLRGWVESFDRALNHVERAQPPKDREETREERDDRVSRNMAAEQAAAQELRAERVTLIATLCSKSPDAETLEALPHRVFTAFSAYLQSKLADPEA
jgi:hypothetical protein